MRFEEFGHIIKLMVLGSSVCNLNCSYCYLNDQHKNNAYVLLNKEIQKAWTNGTYVENIKKVFTVLKNDPAVVEDFEIWGGEPLIMTNNLIKPTYEILTYFKNINSINIPTNFTRINNLVDFCETVEKAKNDINWDARRQGKLSIHIQLSIDAPPGPIQEKGHNFDWNRYRENIDNFCKELATKPKFKNTEVCFEIHATVPYKLILKHLSTVEDIKSYLKYYNEFHTYINSTAEKYGLQDCIIQATDTVFPHTAVPFTSSVEESLEYARIMRLLNFIQKDEGYKHDGEHIYVDNGFSTASESIISANPVCIESGIAGVTIMYDGSICECPCDYILNFQAFWDWIKDNPLKRQTYRDSMLKKQFYINPLTATKEEMDNYDWYIMDSNRINCCTGIHLMMNWCLEMSQSGQLDVKYYKDPELLLRHLYQFASDYSCPREQIPAVHNVYMADSSALKRWFNGFSELALNDLKTNLHFEAKGLYEWNMMPVE